MRAGFLCLVPVLLLLATGCADRRPASGTRYRVVWTARRIADNTPLVAVTSPALREGESVTVRTDSQRPEENRPAFPEFLARLSPSDRRGAVQVVTRAHLREVARNRKGKLKRSQRFIGALLPMRPGETLGSSGPGDPIALDVRLEAVR